MIEIIIIIIVIVVTYHYYHHHYYGAARPRACWDFAGGGGDGGVDGVRARTLGAYADISWGGARGAIFSLYIKQYTVNYIHTVTIL